MTEWSSGADVADGVGYRLTTHCVWVGALAAVAAIGVPVAMYYCTSRWLTSLSEQPHPAVALMQGFTMVFCGCMLLGLTVYLYLGYAEPQWTDLTMRQLAVTQGDNGLGRAMASLVAHGHIRQPYSRPCL